MEKPTSPKGSATKAGTVPRLLSIRLRGGETASGTAFLMPIQSLGPFLSSRKGGLLSLAEPKGFSAGGTGSHVIIRTSTVLFAWADDASLQVDHLAAGGARRRIHVAFDDASSVDGVLSFPSGIRVSDFLARAEEFIPLRDVTLAGATRTSVDLAVNFNAVTTIRDLGPAEAKAGATPAVAQLSTVIKRRRSSLTLVAPADL
jgi:hypothetical protein